MNAQIRTILISSALLIGAGGSMAAREDSEVDSLVRKTLSGQNVSYTHDAYTEQPAVSRGATDASTIVRQVLRGESTGVPTVKRVADLPTADAPAKPGTRSESWQLAQRLLLGHAG